MSGKVEQIANLIRSKVNDKVYGDSGRLPPIAELVMELHASRGVIVKALNILQEEKVIVPSGKSFTPGPLVDIPFREELPTPLQKNKPCIVPTARGEKDYYVYNLVFPNDFQAPDGTDISNLVFYIGKGKWCDPPMIQRIDMHEKEAILPCFQGIKGVNMHKTNAIDYIWLKGRPLVKVVIFETFDEIEAVEYERDAINKNASLYLMNRHNNPFFTERILFEIARRNR